MNEIEETATRVKGMMTASVEAIRQEEKERRAGLSRLAGDVKDPKTMTFTEIEEV